MPKKPIHPGEILREEYLEPLAMSAGALARRLEVPRTRIERLVNEETPVTVDTAMRLARFFGGSPQFWLNLQTIHDLEAAAPELRKAVAKIAPREMEPA